MNGILVIDKPEGLTSHDVVYKIRKAFGNVRAGHLGTLDPMATGVLPICLGKATRIIQFLPSSPKEYVADIRLGFATTTYDREGEPAGPAVAPDVSRDQLVRAMSELTGRLNQTPPPFSAKKVDGVRSYARARRGEAVVNRPVPVEVEVYELTAFQPPMASVRVVCSAGTYIRSLAHDLGGLLGCGAHLTALRRLRSGPFTISQASALADAAGAKVIALERLLEDWPLIEASEDEENRVAHGNAIRVDQEQASDGTLTRIFNKRGEFIAIAALESGWARPRVVLTSIASVEGQI